jgi:hypothetical protein
MPEKRNPGREQLTLFYIADMVELIKKITDAEA